MSSIDRICKRFSEFADKDRDEIGEIEADDDDDCDDKDDSSEVDWTAELFQ